MNNPILSKVSYLILGLMFVSVTLFAQVNQAGLASLQSYGSAGPDGKDVKVKKHIISFGFFSPLNQHISVGYDELISQDIMLSGQLGIIGAGYDAGGSNLSNPKGAFLEAGAKFFFSPDYIYDGMHRYSAIQGTYIKPQAVVSVFNETATTYAYSPIVGGPPTFIQPQPVTNIYSKTYTGVALILNIGKQWVIAHTVSLDIYAGVGYNLTPVSVNPLSSEPSPSDYFSFISGDASFPIALDAGINIGIPF